MSVYNSIIQTAPRGDNNNPYALKSFIKPSRILINNVPPLITTGELNDYYIDSATADFYGPKSDDWGAPVYNFNTGGGSGGITNIINAGIGEGLFKNIVGSSANFKTLLGAMTQINITDGGDEVRFSMNSSYKPETLDRVQNFYVSGDTFPPNGVIGDAQGANLGSIWVQLPDTIWICQNPATSAWAPLITTDGIKSNINLGFGGGKVFKETDPAGVASFRTIAGTVNQITVDENENDVILSMNASYKPATLSNVANVTQGYGELSQPLTTDDDTKGYIKGSLYSEVELGGVVKLWICKDATTGAAQWSIVGNSTSSQNDLYMLTTYPGLQATTFGGVLVKSKLNIGNTLNIITSRGSWSNGSIDSGAVITRVLPSNGLSSNKYLINFNLTLFRSVAAVATTRIYDIQFAEGDGSTPTLDTISGSESILIYQPNTEYSIVYGSFIFSTVSSSAISIYPIITSRDSTAAVFVNYMSIAITEI